MTKQEFAAKVAELVNGEVKEVEKANSIKLTGIMPIGDMRIRPTVYIDQMFEEGKSVEFAANVVREAFEQNKPSVDISIITDFNKAKPLLRARLYNKATNAPVFRSASEYGFDDLIIVPYVQINDEMSVKVTPELILLWGGHQRKRNYQVVP